VAYSVQGAGELLELPRERGESTERIVCSSVPGRNLRGGRRRYSAAAGCPEANFTRASRHVAAAFAAPAVATQLCRKYFTTQLSRRGADAIAAAVDDLSAIYS